MEIKKTNIEDLLIIQPNIHSDHRGYFMESYKKEWFTKNFPTINFIQDNESKSEYGVLRGLHFQKPPYAQTKLIRVIKGEILDVAVDLRNNSSSYLKHQTFILSETKKQQLLIPKGFAHGFLVISKIAIVSYKVDAPFHLESETGISWDDKALNIDWGISKDDIKLSQKDTNYNKLKT
jgi:dTDP-4-dehydrorhamnose 3,5-epimerase